MPGTQRIRILTPEALDTKSANLVGTSGSQLRSAILTLTGSSDPGITFTSAATANAGMKRDANARAQVANPSASLDIANKSYVDTAVAGKVATSTLGAASGVATLDGTTKLTASQVPTYLNQNLGSGTSFPGSPRQGDVYRHTGVGCLFVYNNASWEQLTRATVATRAARDALVTSYAAILHPGFEVHQTDKQFVWKMCSDGIWAYAGWLGGSVFAHTENTAPEANYRRLNLNVPNTGTSARITVTAWELFSNANAANTSREFLSYANGIFTIRDRCTLAINARVDSITTVAGRSQLRLAVPGGSNAINAGSTNNTVYRGAGFSGAGFLEQSVHYIGAVNQNSDFSLELSQITSNSTAVVYNCAIAISILPL